MSLPGRRVAAPPSVISAAQAEDDDEARHSYAGMRRARASLSDECVGLSDAADALLRDAARRRIAAAEASHMTGRYDAGWIFWRGVIYAADC